MAEKQLTQEQSADAISFEMIAHAGDARSYAFQALEAARNGDMEKADILMEKSDEAGTLAHKVQTELLFKEMNGQSTPVTVLLVHAQDHLMTSMLAQELIKEMILMYKTRKEEK